MSFNIYIIVIGMAGNKSDLFDKEQVDENEARDYAEKNGALFKVTSAFMNRGIKELFYELGKIYMKKHCSESSEDKTQSNKKKKYTSKVQLDTKKTHKKKKCC